MILDLIDCREEQQESQQTPDYYESINTSRPDTVVYSHISQSSEPAYENSDVRPKDTSNIVYEDVDAVTTV